MTKSLATCPGIGLALVMAPVVAAMQREVLQNGILAGSERDELAESESGAASIGHASAHHIRSGACTPSTASAICSTRCTAPAR